jgi:hypothetical protein
LNDSCWQRTSLEKNSVAEELTGELCLDFRFEQFSSFERHIFIKIEAVS